MMLRPLPFGATKMGDICICIFVFNFYFYYFCFFVLFLFLFKLLDPFQLNTAVRSERALLHVFSISCVPLFYFYYFRFLRIEEVFLIFCLLHFSQRFYRAIKIIKIKLKLERKGTERKGKENENGNVYEILRF